MLGYICRYIGSRSYTHTHIHTQTVTGGATTITAGADSRRRAAAV